MLILKIWDQNFLIFQHLFNCDIAHGSIVEAAVGFLHVQGSQLQVRRMPEHRGSRQELCFIQRVCHQQAAKGHAEPEHFPVLLLAKFFVDISSRLQKILGGATVAPARRLESLRLAFAIQAVAAVVDDHYRERVLQHVADLPDEPSMRIVALPAEHEDDGLRAGDEVALGVECDLSAIREFKVLNIVVAIVLCFVEEIFEATQERLIIAVEDGRHDRPEGEVHHCLHAPRDLRTLVGVEDVQFKVVLFPLESRCEQFFHII